MKHKKIELDVDFIGGQSALTKEEEQRISEFLKKQNEQKDIVAFPKVTWQNLLNSSEQQNGKSFRRGGGFLQYRP